MEKERKVIAVKIGREETVKIDAGDFKESVKKLDGYALPIVIDSNVDRLKQEREVVLLYPEGEITDIVMQKIVLDTMSILNITPECNTTTALMVLSIIESIAINNATYSFD